MKWNKFISVIKQPQNSNNNYIINYYNGQLIYVVDKLAELVINNTNNIENIFETHPTFAQELYKKGFIVDKNLDIPKMCIEKLNNYYTDRSEIRLTINPTLDCNLRCWYCYEDHKNGTITQIFRKFEDPKSKFILPCCKECKILPICNICGQKKDEFIDGNCPFIDNSDYHHQLIYNYLQKLLTNPIL